MDRVTSSATESPTAPSSERAGRRGVSLARSPAGMGGFRGLGGRWSAPIFGLGLPVLALPCRIRGAVCLLRLAGDIATKADTATVGFFHPPSRCAAYGRSHRYGRRTLVAYGDDGVRVDAPVQDDTSRCEERLATGDDRFTLDQGQIAADALGADDDLDGGRAAASHLSALAWALERDQSANRKRITSVKGTDP